MSCDDGNCRSFIALSVLLMYCIVIYLYVTNKINNDDYDDAACKYQSPRDRPSQSPRCVLVAEVDASIVGCGRDDSCLPVYCQSHCHSAWRLLR